jgi:hypothetical protein
LRGARRGAALKGEGCFFPSFPFALFRGAFSDFVTQTLHTLSSTLSSLSFSLLRGKGTTKSTPSLPALSLSTLRAGKKKRKREEKPSTCFVQG